MPRIEGNSQINFRTNLDGFSPKRMELSGKSSLSGTESQGCLATIWQSIKNFFSALFSCFSKTDTKVENEKEIQVDESEDESIDDQEFNNFFETVLKVANPESKLEDYATPEARQMLYNQALLGLFPIKTNDQMRALLSWVQAEQNPSVRLLDEEALTKFSDGYSCYSKYRDLFQFNNTFDSVTKPAVEEIPPIMTQKREELENLLKSKGIQARIGPCIQDPVALLADYLSTREGVLYTERKLLDDLLSIIERKDLPYIKSYLENQVGKDKPGKFTASHKERLVEARFKPGDRQFRALLSYYLISARLIGYEGQTKNLWDLSDKELEVETDGKMAAACYRFGSLVFSLPIYFASQEDENKFFKLGKKDL